MKNIFIHGLGQTPSSWEKTIAAMTSMEECLCPDLTQSRILFRDKKFMPIYIRHFPDIALSLTKL